MATNPFLHLPTALLLATALGKQALALASALASTEKRRQLPHKKRRTKPLFKLKNNNNLRHFLTSKSMQSTIAHFLIEPLVPRLHCAHFGPRAASSCLSFSSGALSAAVWSATLTTTALTSTSASTTRTWTWTRKAWLWTGSAFSPASSAVGGSPSWSTSVSCVHAGGVVCCSDGAAVAAGRSRSCAATAAAPWPGSSHCLAQAAAEAAPRSRISFSPGSVYACVRN